MSSSEPGGGSCCCSRGELGQRSTKFSQGPREQKGPGQFRDH